MEAVPPEPHLGACAHPRASGFALEVGGGRQSAWVRRVPPSWVESGQEGLESRGPAFALSNCVTERGVLGSLGLSFCHQENELMRPASWVSSEAWVHGGHGPCGLLRQRQAARLAADLTLKGSASSDGRNSPQDPAGLWGAFGLYWIFT